MSLFQGDAALTVNNLPTPFVLSLPRTSLSASDTESCVCCYIFLLSFAPISSLSSCAQPYNTATCQYYDSVTESFRTDGCSLAFQNATITLCACTHMTPFATLNMLLDILSQFNWINPFQYPKITGYSSLLIFCLLAGLYFVLISLYELRHQIRRAKRRQWWRHHCEQVARNQYPDINDQVLKPLERSVEAELQKSLSHVVCLT